MDDDLNHRQREHKGPSLYRSSFTLHSPSGTAWQADTLFGHLCWFIVRQQREAELKRFLARYMLRPGDGDPPILISDGFPGEFLPRPLLRTAAPISSTKAERIRYQQEAKQSRGIDWLTLEDFNRVRRGDPPTEWLTEEKIQAATGERVTIKNWINRLTDTAGDPFDFSEHVLPRVTFYWRIEDGYVDMVRHFLDDLKESGYGKRKSIGYGQIEQVTPLALFTDFEDVPDANGFVTLSRFVPAPDDPTEGFWKAVVKYGKLGEEFATGGAPFKRPLVQLACGSCFRTAEPRLWYGQLLGGLSQRAEVKQYGFAFPLPMRLPKPA